MRPALRALADQQGGVVSRGQTLACGYTARELRTLTGHRGAWIVVRRGAYCERDVWEGGDDDDRHRLGVHAASLVATKDATISHTSAAAFLGFDTRPSWRELQHVTRPGVGGSRTEGGVKHHLAAFTQRDVVIVSGLRMLGRARTAVDIAREHGFEDGVIAADAALRLGVPRSELDAVVARMRHWPRVTAARAAAAYADGGAASIGETLLRLLVLELGLGTPQTQYVVAEDGRRAIADLRLRRHLFEFDGRVKYLGREAGGVADRPAEQVVWDEKRREDWLRRQHGGYGMSRVVWSELFGPARRETKRRLWREVRDSDRRYGDAAQPTTREG